MREYVLNAEKKQYFPSHMSSYRLKGGADLFPLPSTGSATARSLIDQCISRRASLLSHSNQLGLEISK